MPETSLRSRILDPVIMKLRLVPGQPVDDDREAVASSLVGVTPLEYEGAAYVVANRAETRWARTLRAVGRGEFIGWLGNKAFRAVEVDGRERERVVTTYRNALGRLARDYFEQFPNPADHPTFRLEPI
ncbi:MAG TPA: hypothetical protein VF752_08220 [Thermoleophilaceae bacterium]